MADETKQEVKLEDKTPEQVEQEFNDAAVKDVEAVLNPPDESEVKPEVKPEVKSEVKKEVKSEVEPKVKSDEPVVEEVGTEPKPKEEVKVESTKTEDKTDTTRTPAEQVTALNLPNRLIQAAKRNHVTDEEVLSWGDKAENILTTLANTSDRVSEQLGEIGRKAKVNIVAPKKEAEATPELTESEDDAEEVLALKRAIKAQAEKLTRVEQQLIERDQKSTRSQNQERDKKIDEFFDKVEYVEFGKAKSLTPTELVMRKTVWESADNIMVGAKVSGVPITLEDAMTQAMSIYEGKNPRKVKEKLVDEVVKREKQLIHRPRSRKEAQAVPTGDAQAVAAVNKFFKERGKDGW